MCQTHLLTYTCTHTLPIRHSTCRGAFTTTPNPRKPPKPACSGAATLVIYSASACGDCQRRDAEVELEAVGTVVDGAGEGRWDVGREMFALGRRFPSCKRFRGGSSRKVEQRRRAEGAAETGCGESKKVERARGSLLRREVLPEEVVVRSGEWKTLVGEGWDQGDWGDYKSLSDELEENAAAAAAGEDDWTSQWTDCSMTSAMGESIEDYCAAFATNNETLTDENASQNDEECDTSWSPGCWASESSWESTPSPWVSAETTDESSTQTEQKPSGNDERPAPPTPQDEHPPPLTEPPFRLRPPTTTVVRDRMEEHLTHSSLATIPFPPARSSTLYSVLTLPTRGGSKAPTPPRFWRERRSTWDSVCDGDNRGKELELCERLRFVVGFPPLVVCGGGGRGGACE